MSDPVTTIANVVKGDAIGGMAQANEASANQQQGLAVNAAQSPQELAALEMQNSAALQNLSRQQRLVESADPAMIEIGKQTLAMLRGDQTAGTVGVANKQRQAQRSQLEAQLRSQLGPGYANTSAGIAALNNFDSQSADLLTTTQQQAINNYLPTLASISGNGYTQSAGLLGNVAGGYANASGRLANAFAGTSNNVVQTSGGDYARQLGYANTASTAAAAAKQDAKDVFSIFAGGK